jgi:hypothetical protein
MTGRRPEPPFATAIGDALRIAKAGLREGASELLRPRGEGARLRPALWEAAGSADRLAERVEARIENALGRGVAVRLPPLSPEAARAALSGAAGEAVARAFARQIRGSIELALALQGAARVAVLDRPIQIAALSLRDLPGTPADRAARLYERLDADDPVRRLDLPGGRERGGAARRIALLAVLGVALGLAGETRRGRPARARIEAAVRLLEAERGEAAFADAGATIERVAALA